jgi:putative (di)nucleoside polyphosphate hydrolase
MTRARYKANRMEDAAPNRDLTLYRPNVGVVVFCPRGRVWLGRRAETEGPHNWQFPQGGVDDGEDLEAAARRELHEETGLRSVELLGHTQGWIVYDFPPGWKGSKALRGWKGQKQVWFAYRFTGADEEVDLTLHKPPEFDAWRWADLYEAPDLVIPFKRATYDQVVAAFSAYAAAPAAPSHAQGGMG